MENGNCYIITGYVLWLYRGLGLYRDNEKNMETSINRVYVRVGHPPYGIVFSSTHSQARVACLSRILDFLNMIHIYIYI